MDCNFRCMILALHRALTQPTVSCGYCTPQNFKFLLSWPMPLTGHISLNRGGVSPVGIHEDIRSIFWVKQSCMGIELNTCLSPKSFTNIQNDVGKTCLQAKSFGSATWSTWHLCHKCVLNLRFVHLPQGKACTEALSQWQKHDAWMLHLKKRGRAFVVFGRLALSTQAETPPTRAPCTMYLNFLRHCINP